jgi:RNA polymerase sigma factor (sigma-70 family)
MTDQTLSEADKRHEDLLAAATARLMAGEYVLSALKFGGWSDLRAAREVLADAAQLLKSDFDSAAYTAHMDAYLREVVARAARARWSSEDNVLVAEVQDGSVAAYEQLVGRHRGWMEGQAARWQLGCDSPSDIVSDVWLDLWRTRFKGYGDMSTASLQGWLRRVLFNRLASRYSYQQRRRSAGFIVPIDRADGDDEQPPCEPADSANTEDAVVLADTQEEVRQALGLLDQRSAQVLTEKYYEHKTGQEIASNLGITQARVSQIHHTALRRLREHLPR